ncbi:MAG: aldo/keto reductase [Pseudomonadota bacterium]
MEHKRFGRTDLQVPRITFGGGWVGGVLIHQDRDTAYAALDMAIAAGIDWIDTAAGYGNGVSETVIGGWLAERPGTALSGISTKFRLDLSAPDHKGQMLNSVEASLDRLGRESVDLVFLHNQIGAEHGLDANAALHFADVMETLREQGLCCHLGMTALGDPADLKLVVRAGRFDVAQVYYNMLNPTADRSAIGSWNTHDFNGLLHDCAAQDMGTMGIRVFAAGHLASNKRHGREIPITGNADDAAEEARSQAALTAIGQSHGTPAQASLRFGLACDLLSTIVVGLGELDHLRQVIEAAGQGPLPDGAIRALDAARKSAPFTERAS